MKIEKPFGEVISNQSGYGYTSITGFLKSSTCYLIPLFIPINPRIHEIQSLIAFNLKNHTVLAPRKVYIQPMFLRIVL